MRRPKLTVSSHVPARVSPLSLADLNRSSTSTTHPHTPSISLRLRRDSSSFCSPRQGWTRSWSGLRSGRCGVPTARTGSGSSATQKREAGRTRRKVSTASEYHLLLFCSASGQRDASSLSGLTCSRMYPATFTPPARPSSPADSSGPRSTTRCALYPSSPLDDLMTCTPLETWQGPGSSVIRLTSTRP